MKEQYGKLRKEDAPILESVIRIFRKHNLRSGLHGTSLWNSKYKDVDMLVFSSSNDVNSFKKAFTEMVKIHNVEIWEERGNENIGFDYDLKIGKMILHLSFVIII